MATMSDSVPAPRAVVLAGGKGTRLGPYTATLPKPLVPVGDMPILEVVIRRLHGFGIDDVTLAVNHLATLVMAYFGDGARFGVGIDYALEDKPLGTAGPLATLRAVDGTLLVLNGDLLTDIDYHAMLTRHRDSRAAITVGLYERQQGIDFGVVQIDDDDCVVGYDEKPVQQFLVSMGVYLVEPRAVALLTRGERADMPDLVRLACAHDLPVSGYRHRGYWLDIGRPDDYARAQDDFPAMSERLLGPVDN